MTRPAPPPCRNRACRHGILCRAYIAPIQSEADLKRAHRHQGDGADCPDYEPWRAQEPALMVWVDECPPMLPEVWAAAAKRDR